MIFIDSNVFIRLICEDSDELTQKAKDFIKKIMTQNLDCLVEDSVVAEVLFVATSKKLYAHSRIDVVSRFLPILRLSNINHHHKNELITALQLFATSNLDFVDCLALSYKESGVVDEIFSFDKKLKDLI